MNSNTVLIMFAVVAAFGLATATLVVPLVPQADAQEVPYIKGCAAKSDACKDFGLSQGADKRPPGVPPID